MKSQPSGVCTSFYVESFRKLTAHLFLAGLWEMGLTMPSRYEDLDEALRNPEQVVGLRLYRTEGSAEQIARVAELTGLQALECTMTNVSELLPLLDRLTNLRELSFQACDVSIFPETILSLPHLRELNIGNSGVEELPADISRLEHLESLGLSQNELRSVSDSLFELVNLKVLNLSYNRLESLPDGIGDLANLEILFLGSNKLRQLPQRIGELSRLKTLDLNYNSLVTLPESICDLRSLETFYLDSNEFESLPGCMARFTGIRAFTIEASKRQLFMDWTYVPAEDIEPWIALEEMQFMVSPGSEEHAALLNVLEEEEDLEGLANLILKRARNAVTLETTGPDDYTEKGRSRLGGFPDLPSESDFPRTDGLYWIFLGQLNLEQLAPFNNYLPCTGLLSFFLESTESLNPRVLFYEGDMEALTTVRHGGGDEMTDGYDDYTDKPYQVRFARTFSVPYQPPEELESDEQMDAYQDAGSLFAERKHLINGHTFTQHETPQEQAANAAGGAPKEWIELLKLAYDHNVGFCFWDAGTLTFCIHQEDLRRADFSNVRVSLESS